MIPARRKSVDVKELDDQPFLSFYFPAGERMYCEVHEETRHLNEPLRI